LIPNIYIILYAAPDCIAIIYGTGCGKVAVDDDGHMTEDKNHQTKAFHDDPELASFTAHTNQIEIG
jgi:hypothetical protein